MFLCCNRDFATIYLALFYYNIKKLLLSMFTPVLFFNAVAERDWKSVLF
jgi:hypothetical protein